MRNTETVKEAHARFVRTHEGALPTSADIAKAAGITVKYARAVLNNLGLDYQHRKAGSAWRVDTEARDENIRRHYEDLSRSAGRPPTAQELNVALGYRRGSSVAIGASRRLGLKLTPLRRVKEAQKKEQTPPMTPGPVEIPSRAKIFDLLRSSERTGDGTAGLRAGERNAVTDRTMILCPVCGSQKLIAPRMHPFWLRNRADEVIFVCSRGCTGQSI